MNSVGLANIKYVRYPSMIKEIESALKKKIRYVLLGSSNAKGLEMVQPKDDIFNIVDFINISEGGMSASRMNGKDKYFNSYLGDVPLDPGLMAGSDSGKPILITEPNSEISSIYLNIATQIYKKLSDT